MDHDFITFSSIISGILYLLFNALFVILAFIANRKKIAYCKLLLSISLLSLLLPILRISLNTFIDIDYKAFIITTNIEIILHIVFAITLILGISKLKINKEE